MTINTADDKQYMILTPAGVFEAFSSIEPTDKQIALQTILSNSETIHVNSWLKEYPALWLEDFIEQGWIERMSMCLPAPNIPLDQFLPYVAASLSGSRRAVIGSDEGFCLARIGHTQEDAEMLCATAADFSGFIHRQQQRGWAIPSQAVSFFQQVDLLIPDTSFIFLWIEDSGYILIIDGEPLINNRAFVELIWGIKTSGLRFGS